jgi:cell division transport system ATP-binding protein
MEAVSIRKLRCSIGPVFQEFKLIRGHSVMENVMLGMRFLNIPQSVMKDSAKYAIERVGLGHKINAMVENLSWGESQRVAIARAVARKPTLILADEPTGNLDMENALKIMELLKSFKDRNTTVLITTHATHLIKCGKGDLFIHMSDGCMNWERMGE